MNPIVTPIPTEILGWMRGFAATYLEIHGRPALTEAVQEHAGSVLVNFNIQVMVSGSGKNLFMGVDRLKIARRIGQASPEDLADWEYRVEALDPLWKKALCGQLTSVAEALVEGGRALFEGEPPPSWAGDLLSAGLSLALGEAPKRSSKKRSGDLVVSSQAMFLDRSLRAAVQRGDQEAALDFLERISESTAPEAPGLLHDIVSDAMSCDGLETARRQRAKVFSNVGRRALVALARRKDPQVIDLLTKLSRGDKVLFDSDLLGEQALAPDHPMVWDLVFRSLLAGRYGFEGLSFLEIFLRERYFELPNGAVRGTRKVPAVAEDVLQAVFSHRSGALFLRLVAKNPSLDQFIERDRYRETRLYFPLHHLHLLEPLARDGRSAALRSLLHHPDLRAALNAAAAPARERAMQALIALYHQTVGDGDRDAVAEFMEATGRETALQFFRGEIIRLGRVRSLRDKIRTMVLGEETDLRHLLQRRIDRMLAKRKALFA